MRRFIACLSMLFIVPTISTAAAKKAGAALALDGYCPVAYVAMSKAVKGQEQYSLDYAGRHYRFAKQQAREMFQADPSKFQVAYDGYCATAMAMGKKVDSDPTLFTVHDGVTYLFSTADARKTFMADADAVVAKADAQWTAIALALDGYCPVAYVAMSKAVKGQEQYSLDYAGQHYRFAKQQARQMFQADPSKFQVAYDGYCATAMAMGKRVDSDPTLFTVHDGATYLFSSAKAKEMFAADPAGIVAKANAQWAALNN